MKYVRTKDGIILDLEEFINEEKDTPYYKDFEFEEISKDGRLKWTAIGTEKCPGKDQIGRRCHFSATLNSEVIKQADTIPELFDELVLVAPYRFRRPKTATELEKDFEEMIDLYTSKDDTIYGAIWTKGEHDEPILKSIAKMKGVLPNGEIDWELL